MKSSLLPPPTRVKEVEKTLSAEDVEKIKQLRQSDPVKNSLRTLGKMFGVNPLTISEISKDLDIKVQRQSKWFNPKTEYFSHYKRRLTAIRRRKMREALLSTGANGM